MKALAAAQYHFCCHLLAKATQEEETHKDANTRKQVYWATQVIFRV